MIATIEDLIIAKLRTQLPAIDTQPLPLDPAELGYPVTENQIFVAFESETFDSVDGRMVGRQFYRQSRILRYQLILRLLDLNNQRRSYAVLDVIRASLTGIGGDRRSRTGLYQISGGFKQYAEGLWLYQMRFEFPTSYTLEV